MPQISRDDLKKKGLKRIFYSIKYSIEGLVYAYRYEQSLWLHGIATIFSICLGIIFKIKLSEWATIFIVLGVILGIELLNTAIEAAVDLVTLEKNPLAKRLWKCCNMYCYFSSNCYWSICFWTIFYESF